MHACLDVPVPGGESMTKIGTVFFLLASIVSGSAFGRASDSLQLAENGHSKFRVLLPPDASEGVKANVDTLRRYFREVTSANLPVASGTDAAKNQVIIQIGDSRNGRGKVSELGQDGFIIRTIDGNLYLTAQTDYGFQNAVYTFIESYLGCRMYSPSVRVIPKRSRIMLPETFDRQAPVITFR